jgi:myo-inositol-1(or 4)-monophosphatase
MDQKSLQECLDFAVNVAGESGKVLKKYWGKLSHIEEKEFAWDLVTEADKESEEVILNLLQKEYPSYDILSEESGLKEKNHSEYLWVVDPLDGTTNYTHQYPMVSVSIALTYKENPVIGVVYNPIYEELIAAADGLGCTMNGEHVQVSKAAALSQSLLATGFAYDRLTTSDNNYAEFCHLTNHSQGVRRGGSAALDLAYVAAGRLDGFWERGLKFWDIAAGVVLIKEAGGCATSYSGGTLDLKSGRILASNGLIHKGMVHELQLVREGKTPKY